MTFSFHPEAEAECIFAVTPIIGKTGNKMSQIYCRNLSFLDGGHGKKTEAGWKNISNNTFAYLFCSFFKAKQRI